VVRDDLLCPGADPPAPLTGQETGIDLGVESFATLSHGERALTPACYRKAERRLKTAQRRVSRRKKGSKRRKRAIKLLAKAHQTVRRQRQDFQHMAALSLVRTYEGMEGHFAVWPGGSARARLDRVNFERVWVEAVDLGLVTDDELKQALALLEDPAIAFSSPVMFCAWGGARLTENRPESPCVHAGDEWPLAIPRP
jgi:Probable transposase